MTIQELNSKLGAVLCSYDGGVKAGTDERLYLSTYDRVQKYVESKLDNVTVEYVDSLDTTSHHGDTVYNFKVALSDKSIFKMKTQEYVPSWSGNVNYIEEIEVVKL